MTIMEINGFLHSAIQGNPLLWTAVSAYLLVGSVLFIVWYRRFLMFEPGGFSACMVLTCLRGFLDDRFSGRIWWTVLSVFLVIVFEFILGSFLTALLWPFFLAVNVWDRRRR